MSEVEITGAVLVIGGGISGIQAALDLANSGFFVHLVDHSGSIGGTMPQLDKTFPTNDCSICIIAPKLVECERHLNINILTLSKVLDIEGEAGNFTVRIKQYPRYINTDKCIACGQCAEVCPQQVPDEFNNGLDNRKAVFIKFPQAVPQKYQIDQTTCIELSTIGQCKKCQEICPAEAINFNDREKKHSLKVGSVIVATGFQPFTPPTDNEWSFGTLPNVITSMQLERFFAATGPTQGNLTKPSNGGAVHKIAFLQCVGSRNKNRCDNEYCSSICCMYTLKEALLIKEHLPETEITVYFSDMRTHGKDFDLLFNQARDQHDIQFIRARVHSINPGPDANTLQIHYANEQGKQVDKSVDLAVLSIGVETPAATLELAEKLGIHVTSDRFASISALMPVSSSRDGIFTCGAFNGPRDIPQAVIGGSAAAACTSRLLQDARYSLTKEEPTAEEVDTSQTPPNIGVFICHCGSNISSVIDIEKLTQFSKELSGVSYVDQNIFTCSQDSQEYIRLKIIDNNLNRIVIAACSPQTHEPLFREMLKQAGINEYMVEMANIRNQASWVHKNEPDGATEKAKDLIKMAVAKVTLQESLHPQSIPVIPSALIVGGGVSGMTAGLNLSSQGFNVDLIEKSNILGGNALHLYQTWNGENVPRYIKSLVLEVESHENITVHYNSTVTDFTGHPGHFTSTIKTKKGRKKTIEHGATLITTGGKRYIPNEFGYGKIQNVVASIEFDKLHMHNENRVTQGRSFVFIQCVGSRTEERPHCSKSCCTHSIQSAIKLKQEVPSRNIYILYREIRTYGQRERIYNQARELGIIFINFDLHGPPEVTENETALTVTTFDHVLHRPVDIFADMVILASATLPNKDSQEVAKLFKLTTGNDGFFQEAHAKLRPVECSTDGIFLAGLAHYPKPLEESINQSLAAASKATTLLSKESITLDAVTALVDHDYCDGCALCIDACPYAAITLIEYVSKDDEELKTIKIAPTLCKGCGICQGLCPKRGVNITTFSHDQLLAQIDAALLEDE